MTVSISVVNRLGSGEEAGIIGRVDLNDIDDRHDAAKS